MCYVFRDDVIDVCDFVEMETNANQKVSCIVNYTYDASENDELTIRPGDVLRDVERLDGGWWRGELRGRVGMFPDNFVSALTTEQGSTRPTGVQGRCRAVFSYQPANPDELPLCVGDVLDVLGEVEEGWWQGRRQGRVGVFPSNFVVMLDPQPAPLFDAAPALPPKPVKEQCRVLYPYSAVNDDELTLTEGDVVTIVSKDAPDKGWWRGELNGKVGLFPDNFVQLIGTDQPVEEKKPDRPPVKATNIYPILNKYSEKTSSIKELTTSKISSHKENSLSKEISTQSTVTHTNKSESDKTTHSETIRDGDSTPEPGEITRIDEPLEFKNNRHSIICEQALIHNGMPTVHEMTQISRDSNSLLKKNRKSTEVLECPRLNQKPKKPPLPLKKSPTPVATVGGIFTGLKNKMLPSSDKDKDKDKEKDKDRDKSPSNTLNHTNGTWDRTDGATGSKPASNTNTFDHIERNSILNDPRVSRVKAPRRRPPSQVLRDDIQIVPGLSNGHSDDETSPNVSAEKFLEKPEEITIKPRAREWEKHRAPWMDELKLNQAKKSTFAEVKSKSVSSESSSIGNKSSGSTDRILEVGLEEKKTSHSMEMSKSTSSISSKMSILESFEETKVRHSMEPSKRDSSSREPEIPVKPVNLTSPTAAGRTFTSMLDEIKKPPAPAPPSASVRTEFDKSPNKTAINTEKPHTNIEKPHANTEKLQITPEKPQITPEKLTADKNDVLGNRTSVFEKSNTLERLEKEEKSLGEKKSSTLERRMLAMKADKNDATETLITHLNNRILNLEKLLEVQNTKFNAAIEELNTKLALESEKRKALQAELEKFAHCVTQV